MTKVKYIGTGMSSKGVDFSPTRTNGLYDLPDEAAEYLLKTFPRQFELIEQVKTAEVKEAPEKKPRAKRTRKKSTETSED